MPQFAQIIGPAGTGKTTELLRLMDMALERDIFDPHLVGFCSYTRAARKEAAARAADRFSIPESELTQYGYFKTIHALAYQGLRVGKELLAGSKDDKDWLQNALGEELQAHRATTDDEFADPFAGSDTDVGKALALWDTARNRLEPYQAIWDDVRRLGDDLLPPLSYCESVVSRYELAKRLDKRCDFTDMLTRFSGWHCELDGMEKCEPDGYAPDLPIWFMDEWQDASRLTHEVAIRLTSQPSVQWVYCAGDDAQSIYHFNGGDPHWLREGWPMAKRRVLQQSYRCPENVVRFGEAILQRCYDSHYYADRNVRGTDVDGIIGSEILGCLDGLVDPRESWLLMTRTNFLAAKVGKILDDACIPWISTKGGGRWNCACEERSHVSPDESPARSAD